MKKIIITILIIAVISAGYWLVSPFWRTERVSEDLPVESPNVSDVSDGEVNGVLNNIDIKTEVKNEAVAVKAGIFTGFDKVHNGSGTARMLKIGEKNYIRFEEDFNVTNGPDLYVGLGENGKYIKGSELGKLKGNAGSQNYELPAGMSTDDVKEVWIWCKLFSVPFAKAVLN